MFDILRIRLKQGHRTTTFPRKVLALPENFRGRPTIDGTKCPEGCRMCVEACPTGAISTDNGLTLDLGKCLFCTECVDACPPGAITYTSDYRLAVNEREHLILSGADLRLATRMRDDLYRVLGRALRLREVCAGSCNACDLDTNVLNTVGWDLSRFGIQFVASPRHADGIVVTGCVTENMRFALKESYDAIPEPKLVIAVGACAISGGPFAGSPQQHNGAVQMIPIDLFIPGCPPHPLSILDGLLRLLGTVKGDART